MADTKRDIVAFLAAVEEVAVTSPRTIRVIALTFVLLGFLYILLVLAAILFAGWAIGEWLTRQHEPEFLLLLVPTVLILFASVVDACWVRIPRVKGTELSRDEAPALYAMIDELALRLDTSVHRVIVNTKFNASASSERRWIFARRRNVIIVGYPLLCALDTDDWRSILAHEVAHVKSAHAHKRDIFYRATTAWTALEARLRQRKHWASILFTWIFQRFAQAVSLLAMALSRQQEREADMLTATLVGERPTSDALLRLAVRRSLTDAHFWSTMSERAKREPAPPSNVYSHELPAFLARMHELDARAALRTELRQRTVWDDSHPAAYERHIKPLNLSSAEEAAFVDTWVLPPVTEAGAQSLLSDAARARLAAQFDVEWQEARSKTWRVAYERAEKLRGELAALDAAMTSRELAKEDRAERARLIALLEDDPTAEPVLRAALVESPDETVLVYLLAIICLRETTQRASR